MIETLTRWSVLFALVVQPVFLIYFLLYNTYTLWLIALSATTSSCTATWPAA